MDDFEKAVLFSFDQSGVVDDGLKARAAPAAGLTHTGACAHLHQSRAELGGALRRRLHDQSTLVQELSRVCAVL